MSVRRVGATALLAVLLTTFAVAVAPAPASAALSGYDLHFASPSVAPPGSTASNLAVCDQGKPLGGGVRPSSRNLRLVEMYPLPTFAGWTVTVANEGPNQDTLVAATICANASLAYQQVKDDRTVGPGQTVTAEVQCDSGRTVFGGGVFADLDSLRVVSSFPLEPSPSAPNGGWSVTVANGGSNSSGFDVYAVCDNTASPRFAFRTFTVSAGQTLAVSLSCPSDTKPVSGGVQSASNSLRMIESFPSGTETNPTGWIVTVANTGTSARSFVIHAVCAA